MEDARYGAMEEAWKIYDEAKRKHSKLSCRLEQFDKAVEILGEMKQYGVQPRHDEYNKLIKSLCVKALDWEAAEKLQDQMGENNLIMNGRTRAFISAIKELKEGDLKVPSLV